MFKDPRFESKASDTLDMRRWAPLALRLIVGYGFAAHGYAKLSRGADAFAGVLRGIGVPAPVLTAHLTIFIELAGGMAVMLGAFVWAVSIPLTVVLVVAMFTVHLPYGFSSIKLIAVTAAGPQFGPPGYEVDLLYIAALVALVLGGPGSLSIQGVTERQKRPNRNQYGSGSRVSSLKR